MVGKDFEQIVLRSKTVLDEIQALQRGDRVLVLWHDACRVINDPDVRAEYYSTPKETQGTVWDCVPDPEFSSVYYLIVTGERTGGKADYYDAIPIAWISKIQKLEFAIKQSKMAEKFVPLARVIVYKYGKPIDDSGGIAKLPRKYAGSKDTAPRKFVEEIQKTVVG